MVRPPGPAPGTRRGHGHRSGLATASIRMISASCLSSADSAPKRSSRSTRRSHDFRDCESSLLAHADTCRVREFGRPRPPLWCRHQTETARGQASRVVRLAEAPQRAAPSKQRRGTPHPARRRRPGSGGVGAVDALPASVGPDERARAEGHLLKEADRQRCQGPQVLGGTCTTYRPRRRRRRAGEEARGRGARRRPPYDPEAVRRRPRHLPRHLPHPRTDGAMLTSPWTRWPHPSPDPIRRETSRPEDPGRPPGLTPELLGQAFCHWSTGSPPTGCRSPAGRTSPWWSPWPSTPSSPVCGPPISTPAAVSPRRPRGLACQAGSSPRCSAASPQLLDLGRRVRLHTEPQRIAMALGTGTAPPRGAPSPPPGATSTTRFPGPKAEDHRQGRHPALLPTPHHGPPPDHQATYGRTARRRSPAPAPMTLEPARGQGAAGRQLVEP